MTMGHLEDHFRLIDNPDEVARLFKAARTSTDLKHPSPKTYDPEAVENKIMLDMLRRRQAERESAVPKPPSRPIYDYEEIENKYIDKMFDDLRAEREAKDK
jgi:hypothetical protein